MKKVFVAVSMALAPLVSLQASVEASLELAVLAELNAARFRAGTSPVELHPALGDLARWRAALVASTGSADTDTALLREMGRRLRRHGYQAHVWIQSLLVGGGGRDTLERLRLLRPEWYERAVTDDFEHVGVGLSRHDGSVVVSIVLGLSKRTWLEREAAPLAELERVRATMLETVNAARRDKGLAPLEPDPRLDAAAQRHAEDMLRRAYYSHISLDGDSVRDRVRAAGYPRPRAVAENIAKGLFGADEVVTRWLSSPGHRKNILRRRFQELGGGVAFGFLDDGELEVIWVQVFADP